MKFYLVFCIGKSRDLVVFNFYYKVVYEYKLVPYFQILRRLWWEDLLRPGIICKPKHHRLF